MTHTSPPYGSGSSPFQLTGERVLISGAAGGIGSATARACAQLGADLVLTDIRRPTELEEELAASGYRCQAFALDNTRRDDVEALLADMAPFDAVADCSGMYLAGDWSVDPDSWERGFEEMMRTNVMGPLNLLRACLPAMRERGTGRIALLGSIAAHNGGTSSGVNAGYVASKGAIHSLVRHLARSLVSTGVVVNAVAPGPILTPMVANASHAIDAEGLPMGRLGDPAEIGWPLAFLCSTAVTYMTGMVLDINGGLRI